MTGPFRWLASRRQARQELRVYRLRRARVNQLLTQLAASSDPLERAGLLLSLSVAVHRVGLSHVRVHGSDVDGVAESMVWASHLCRAVSDVWMAIEAGNTRLRGVDEVEAAAGPVLNMLAQASPADWPRLFAELHDAAAGAFGEQAAAILRHPAVAS